MFKKNQPIAESTAYHCGYIDGYLEGRGVENPFTFTSSNLAKAYEEGREDGIERWNEREKR